MLNSTNNHPRIVFVSLLLTTFSLLGVLAPVQAEEVTQSFKGLTLNANLELAQGKNLEEGIVLILHGVMGHNRMEIIETSQQFLLENDQSSLAINLSLGIDNRQGFYNCDVPSRHRLEDAIDELDVWVEWLRKRGVSEITLIGHSRGANQIMVYMDEKGAPEIKRLVFLAPATVSTRRQMYESRFGKIEPVLARAEALIAAGKGEELMADTDFALCPKTQVTPNAFVSGYRDDSRFQSFQVYLPNINVPVLILTGTNDERQPHVSEHVVPYIDGERVQLKVIEGAGHFFRDFNIEEALEAALEFMSAI